MLEGFHLRVARILGQATQNDGFALGGGYGLQAHGLVERPSEDLDSYVNSMDPAVFVSAEQSLVRALRVEGIEAVVTKEQDWFRAIHVSNPATGEQISVDLAYDYRGSPPIYVEGIGPVIGIEDIVLGKVRAFVDRQAERDYFDIDGILQDGRWSPRDLFEKVSPIRPELTWEQFSSMLSSAPEKDIEAFSRLGMRSAEIPEMFDRLALASQGGDVYVKALTRGGRPVRAYWRTRAQR